MTVDLHHFPPRTSRRTPRDALGDSRARRADAVRRRERSPQQGRLRSYGERRRRHDESQSHAGRPGDERVAADGQRERVRRG